MTFTDLVQIELYTSLALGLITDYVDNGVVPETPYDYLVSAF